MTTGLRLFLAEQPWMQLLSEQEQARVITDTFERHVASGGYVCRAGEPAEQWIGVISGLVKASVMTSQGKTTTYAGITAGGWLGEGSVLNGTLRRFDVIALRDSYIAYVPRSTFMYLYNTNIRFCHFLISQLNKRLAQQMALIEIDRLVDAETRVAKFIIMLVESQTSRNPTWVLEINQAELAQLCGLSRQFINRVFAKLTAKKIIDHSYGRLNILDKDRLQNFDEHS
ncbi:Crp/Fnr family transcriptional regulator [Noviherbaspirillum sedimenti]|uniref:Crp/Fnr family transcriptional regulator n=1 Tax=Noviherbaspirillum sedimenti TaxID=2320865 RepID=A0A3A3G3A6_9BURK|nr:Crp/Fnr family transcriptional regulator [Noviherbaspirillum sedimenti]RJG02957.1 Crp/Fnr family transcriptional regulator [Noviherbaspirillum sedimenti]